MGQLLLQHDGVLAEAWNPLDSEPPYQPPDTWDAPHVQHRFAEAISTLLKRPLGRWDHPRSGNAGRRIITSGRTLLPSLVMALMGSSRRGNGATGSVSCRRPAMERALEWPGRLLRRHLELAQALNICALAQARQLPVEDVVRRGKHAGVRSPTEWHRLALEAAHRIGVGQQVDRIPASRAR
jgi:hypothetical protein